MKVVIDTSSLISLVRYYLPFDKSNILFDFIKAKVECQEIIILDAVFQECRYTSKGIVVSTLNYMKLKKNQINTTDLLPTRKFFNQLENNFINAAVKNRLSNVEFQNRKNDFLKSADAKLLLYSQANSSENIIIVSEETETSNDNKSFKKIPAICKLLNLEIITLPELLKRNNEIKVEFK